MNVDYTRLRKEAADAINDAVNAMKGSLTRDAWRSRKEESFLLSDNGNIGAREIIVRDFAGFGDKFVSRFQERVSILFNGMVIMKTIWWSLGQGMLWRYGEKKLRGFNLEQVNQVILHYAVDFEQADYALLWKTDLLKQSKFPRPTHEYYPGILRKLGNFYYNTEADYNKEVRIVETKVYSSMFKKVHSQAATSSFLTDRISSDLLYCNQSRQSSTGSKQKVIAII